MNAQICTRPDIVYASNVLARFQSNPGEDHRKAANSYEICSTHERFHACTQQQ